MFPVRRLPADGVEAWQQVVERGYEGYVAKDEATAYEGGATRRWLKVKQKGWTLEEDRWQRRIFGGGQAMMQVARRASLFVVLALAPVGTACAGVLWTNVYCAAAPQRSRW